MPTYYYTPLFDGEYFRPDPDTGDPTSQGTTREPGLDTGSGPEWAGDDPGQPPGERVWKYDDAVPRCVVGVEGGVSLSVYQGWVEKTKAEVDVDYPGLLPGGV